MTVGYDTEEKEYDMAVPPRPFGSLLETLNGNTGQTKDGIATINGGIDDGKVFASEA